MFRHSPPLRTLYSTKRTELNRSWSFIEDLEDGQNYKRREREDEVERNRHGQLLGMRRVRWPTVTTAPSVPRTAYVRQRRSALREAAGLSPKRRARAALS